MEKLTKVGVGVLIFKENKILLGKRINSHGDSEYNSPGGHLEYMETFEECAIRETREETGIEIENIKFMYLANLQHYAPKHYVHIQLQAEWKFGTPKVLETEKIESWNWFDVENLPSPVFRTDKIAIENLNSNEKYIPKI